jgi:hypothetical protein
MSRRRLRWLVLSSLGALLLAAMTVWLLTPTRIDERVLPGMTRAEVESITGQTPRFSMLWSSADSERYTSPDGDLIVKYAPTVPLESESDVVVDRKLTRPKSLWQRIREWLGW